MGNNVKIIWATPNPDKVMAFCARVSNPSNQHNANFGRLLKYCMEHGHVSIFEMANVCMELETTRDIGRQILRHRSFSFQEFSQRYASVHYLESSQVTREARLQDVTNRQNSLENKNPELQRWWESVQANIIQTADRAYSEALSKGIAKEQARAVLPEGLTMSRLYVNGTMRSWIHYLKQRLDPTTQKEHRELAEQILGQLRTVAPITVDAFFPVDVA